MNVMQTRYVNEYFYVELIQNLNAVMLFICLR